jgi:hypothetical protein
MWFFDTYSMDRPRLEYEPLLILKFFRDLHDLITKTTFYTRFRRKLLGKNYIFRKILINRRNYFGKFFLHNKSMSETYFLTILRFWKAANKLGDL